MIWLSEKLRKILTPPDPAADLRAAIEVAKLSHAKRLHLRKELKDAVHSKLARPL